MEINNITIDIGDVVKFHSLNDKELHLIEGTVKSIGAADRMGIFGDIIRYHQEVLESAPTAGIELTPSNYNFMLIEDHQGIQRLYAPAWILESSFEKVEETNVLDIKIFGIPDTERQVVLNLLRDNHYIVE